MARVQRARARARRGRAHAAARARQVPRDLRAQPRRVLHGARGRPARPGRRAGSTRAGRTASVRGRRSSRSRRATRAGPSGTRASGRTSAAALEEHGIRVVTARSAPRRSSRPPTGFSRTRFPGAHAARRRPGTALPVHLEPVLSLAVWVRDPASGHETFARVKVPKEVLPRFVPIGEERSSRSSR